jgi:ribokinase
MFNKAYDFLAVGDITTDAFIRLKEAHVNCSINKEDCEICMKFADKIPYEFVEVVRAVGNSPNAAVAASRLGLSSALVANIGNDENGEECLETLKKEKVATKFVTKHRGSKTNYHYVLWYQDDRTILVKHEDYQRVFPENVKAKYVYLSSIGDHTEEYHRAIADHLGKHPDTKLVFQPGTYQMKFGTDVLKDIYARTEIFFCNTEEARRILKTESEDIQTLLESLHALGPKIVVITDGAKGAYASDGKETWFMPPYPDPKPPYDRTGAGDAFASTFTSAIILGKTIPEALRWAPINSMSVVQEIGAQRGLLTQEKLGAYLAKAPADYVPKQLSKNQAQKIPA